MNLYQRMTQTLALNMGDTILVRKQFKEAIVRIAELEKALSESERISKSWKVQWEAMLQDERKEKALRCSLQDSLSDIKDACSFNNTVMVEYYSRREKFSVRLIQQCYDIAVEALKK